MQVRKQRLVVRAAWVALAVCALSVGGTDEDCPGDVECVVVVGTRDACEGACVTDVTHLIEQQRQEELRRRIEQENRAALEALMDRLWQSFRAEMFVTGIFYCVANHSSSGVSASLRDATSIVIEDLPGRQLGEARRTRAGDSFVTVVDLEQSRDLASEKGAPLEQVVSEIVLHEFIHHQDWDLKESAVLRETSRRYRAMFGIPGPNTKPYDVKKHGKVPTC